MKAHHHITDERILLDMTPVEAKVIAAACSLVLSDWTNDPSDRKAMGWAADLRQAKNELVCAIRALRAARNTISP